ncbi:multidrug effflux MFS transporter [Chiayiivirga flava]|uniref:Bcr/CflA family efflux transporter n=1 Tax=Chiayiivirga flava TaxID=659595 RepID=A0A7W8D7W8_9GAMM|nr:multidrug effflux MFS transporter [Chiayiivirga flava]MBB5209539.1 DHA1 family bicyclomycin/chloramphenicol resistance-like MFS transporter [Chiayiivirga flava]
MPSLAPSARLRLALLLGALAMFGPFAIDTIFPAFPEIERDFAVSAAAMQQTISVYLLAYALVSIFHGPISDARGRKPVILWGVVVFALASVGAALAQTLPQLLAARAVQGMSAGAGLIVGRAIIRDCLDGHDAQRLMSQVTMIFSVAPAIAPIFGGWIMGWSQWRTIFWSLSAFSAVLLLLCLLWLPETHPPANRVALKFGPLFRGSWAIARNRRFLLLSFAGCMSFGALFLYIASAPVFVLDILKLNQQQFGWFFVPTIVGMMLGAFASGRMAGRLSQAATAGLGFGVSIAAAAINVAYNLLVDAPGLPWAVLPMALNAFGIALVFPIVTLAILDLYPRQRGAASSMQAFVGLTFNAALAGLVSPLASRGGATTLAFGGAGLSVAAWIVWRIYRSEVKREPDAALRPSGLEPTEHL